MHTIKKPFGRLALLALALSPITALLAGASYQFEPVRVPENFGTPVAIDDRGTLLLGGMDGNAALLNGNSVKPITIPKGAYPAPAGLNAKGTIVGTAMTDDLSASFGFMLTKQGKMTELNVPGTFGTQPMGINDSGVVVGAVFSEDGLTQGFVWDSRGPRQFAVPGVHYTELVGINESGTIVGNYYYYGEPEADFGMFTLQGSKYTQLKTPGYLWPIARGINSRGEIVGAYLDSNYAAHGFIYYRGVLTPVDYVFPEADAPASFPPEPFDLGDGRTGTVTYVRAGGFTSISGINDSGDIVGMAGIGYTATVECEACGVTEDDLPGMYVEAYFTGDRNGCRGGQMKPHGKPRCVSVPHGTRARDFTHGRFSRCR